MQWYSGSQCIKSHVSNYTIIFWFHYTNLTHGTFYPQVCVLKAMLGYFQLLHQSNTTETLLDMHSLMMNSDLEE